MAVSAKLLTFDSTRMSVGIGVTHKADGPGIAVPVAVSIRHEAGIVCLRVGPFNAIEIAVTRDAHRIGSLAAVARRARFDIATCKPRVFSTAAPDADGGESRHGVRCGFEGSLIDIAARRVTRRTELRIFVARLAFHRFAFCSNAVREFEIQVVHFLKYHSLSAINGRLARGMRRH